MKTKTQTRDALIANRIRFLRNQLDLISNEIASLASSIENRCPNTASDLFGATFAIREACESLEETGRAMYALRDALNDIRLVIAQTATTTEPKTAEAARAWYDSQPTFGDWLEANGGIKPGSERRVR